MIKAVHVDNLGFFREGFKSLFAGDPHIELIGEAATSDQIFTILNHQKLHLLFIDTELPEISGTSLTEKIKLSYPGIKIIMLSGDKSEYTITAALRAGADGYLHKNTSKEEIKKAVSQVMEGDVFFGSSVTPAVLRSYANIMRDKEHNIPGLNQQEIEMVKLLSRGNSTKEISEKLSINNKTAQRLKSNILKKLNLKTVPELICFAIKHHYVYA
ncbi:MAG: response regulator transcription factor [Prolixibacteraceae bacterium]|nr:response regulator transcription factor [Prolixibacteraceae bacterium]